MRITNSMLSELESMITSRGLTMDLFDYAVSPDKLRIQYKFDTFFFSIRRLGFDNYTVGFSGINDNPDGSYHENKTYHVVKIWYVNWLSAIIDDRNFSNNAFRSIDNELRFIEPMKIYSERFISIYKQALSAEKSELYELNGMGYRKSLEILIKDYLIIKKKETKSKISKMSISSCIDLYIEDVNISLLAKRIQWLGNDHAHYYKAWPSKTISDIKDLLHEVIKWIQLKDELEKMEKKVKKITREMQNRKHKNKNITKKISQIKNDESAINESLN